jgi:MFS superfamily sulfate permease-like transporter
VALDDLGPLAIAAAGMAFVTLADTMALSRTFARRRGETADPNREIFALGMTNMAAGLFQGFPVSGSSSRTAVAWALGSRSQLTGVVGALCVVAVLVFANGITRNMPDAVLAAIVIVAAFTLFDFEEMSWLWRVRRSEFFLAAAALTGVAVVGVLEGILVAIVLSLGNFVRRAWRPHDAVLGRMERRKGYHDVERHPDARQVPGLLIYRFDAPIFFANADYFDRRLRAGIAARGEPVRWIVVAAEPVTDIDTTGAEMLHHLLDDLESRGIVLAFAELKGPVKDRLRRYGLYERIGEARFLPTLGLAIDVYLEHTGVDWVDWTDRIRDEPADAPSR